MTHRNEYYRGPELARLKASLTDAELNVQINDTAAVVSLLSFVCFHWDPLLLLWSSNTDSEDRHRAGHASRGRTSYIRAGFGTTRRGLDQMEIRMDPQEESVHNV